MSRDMCFAALCTARDCYQRKPRWRNGGQLHQHYALLKRRKPFAALERLASCAGTGGGGRGGATIAAEDCSLQSQHSRLRRYCEGFQLYNRVASTLYQASTRIPYSVSTETAFCGTICRRGGGDLTPSLPLSFALPPLARPEAVSESDHLILDEGRLPDSAAAGRRGLGRRKHT